jgi:uncharacterized PurR-regulated membrane protein YhhQ (DUF165 family)
MEDRHSNLKLIILGGALAFTLIFSNFIVNYSFDIGVGAILFSVFTYPLVYLFSNLITAKYGMTKSLLMILVALVLQFFVYIINNIISAEIVANDVMLASASSYLVSTLINLIIFAYLLSNHRVSFWTVFATFLFVNLLDTFSFHQVLNTIWPFASGVYIDTLTSTVAKTIVSIIPAVIIHRKYSHLNKEMTSPQQS